MNDDEMVKEFLVESHENLDQLDQDLVTLEADPTNPELLSRIFRAVHTIKGSCGFLGYSKLEWVTHAGENLLSRMRDGALQLNAEVTTALLSLVDAVRTILKSIETSGSEGDANYDELIDTLNRLLESESAPAPEPETEPTPAPEPQVKEEEAEEPSTEDVDQSADVGDLLAILDEADDAADEPPVASAGRSQSGRQPLEQYLLESYEHADQLDQDLISLESEPNNAELLNRITGTLHTLKSSSGMMGFSATEAAAHEGENLLSGLAEGELDLSAGTTTALLSLVDVLRQALVEIETSGNEQGIDYAPLLETLKRLQGSDGLDQPSQQEVATPSPATEPAETAVETPTPAPAQSPAQVANDPTPPETSESAPPATRSPSVADTSIRVDVRLLDMLMDQVGELVLARNRIMQFGKHQDDRQILAAYQRLDLITSELQEGVMKTRMQPIGTIWNKFPRVVRDLARGCGKQVQLIMEGEETELDRTLIEAIRDPLTHLVRNAVDHGLESPEDRRQAGKPETGSLFLRAYHEGGQVNIEITDDGGGIDPQRIAKRALERNLISPQQADQMNDRDVLNLIFTAGFSTAEKVTNVSGRGVGMDVVRNNIEKINGAIDIQSKVGTGTTIRVKIPLTLAIVPALIVRCDGDRYAIPQTSLIELVRLEGEDAVTKVETIQGAPVYRLRGKLLPLVYLHKELDVDPPAQLDQDASANQVVNIVVLQADERQFGLVVEQVLDTEEIVVKPLGKQEVAVFAGATIMGDGTVALILDVLGLAQRANVVSERRDSLQTETTTLDADAAANYQTLLLFESSTGARMAIPLSRVTRLEKFAATHVERSGLCEVVQYWGQAMPLIDVADCLSGNTDSAAQQATGEAHDREVVVLTIENRSIGLVVDRIIDTVEGSFVVQPLTTRPGVAGTVIVQQQVTELLNLDEIIQIAGPAISFQLSAAVEG